MQAHHKASSIAAPAELSARARALAEHYGIARVATVCSVDREALLATIARWPQRVSTIARISTHLDQLEQRGYGAEVRR